MKPSDRHLSMAHLWLFSAGLDAEAKDTNGDPLSLSLAKRFAWAENQGRQEAAAHWITVSEEFEHEEPTARHSVSQQIAALDASARKKGQS